MTQLGNCRNCGRGECAELWCEWCQGAHPEAWLSIVSPATETLTPDEAFRRDKAIHIAVTSALWPPVQYGVIENVREF